MAAIPGSGIDALVGTGGTPEGIIAAAAIRALGGEFLARFDPQLASESAAVARAGIDTTRWYRLEEIVRSQDTLFCATGITTGLLFNGVERFDDHDRLQTLMISGATGERQLLTTYRPHGKNEG